LHGAGHPVNLLPFIVPLLIFSRPDRKNLIEYCKYFFPRNKLMEITDNDE